MHLWVAVCKAGGRSSPGCPWAVPAGLSIGHSVSFHKVLHAQEEEGTKFQPHREIRCIFVIVQLSDTFEGKQPFSPWI